MAVKIVRQPNKIALIGAPSSAAGFAPGTEKAPAALRAAGLVEKLQSIGYEVTDLGDCASRLFADDDEHKRARNIPEIVASLNDLKPRAELAAKSGGLILVLGGDCIQIVGILTGARRYYKHISLLWFDRRRRLEHAREHAFRPAGRHGVGGNSRPGIGGIGALLGRAAAGARAGYSYLRPGTSRSRGTGFSDAFSGSLYVCGGHSAKRRHGRSAACPCATPHRCPRIYGAL